MSSERERDLGIKNATERDAVAVIAGRIEQEVQFCT